MTCHDLLMGLAASIGAAIITAITVLLDPIVMAAGARRRRL